MSAVLNLAYHALIGFPMCVIFVTLGLVFCCTIVGIPFGIALVASGIKML